MQPATNAWRLALRCRGRSATTATRDLAVDLWAGPVTGPGDADPSGPSHLQPDRSWQIPSSRPTWAFQWCISAVSGAAPIVGFGGAEHILRHHRLRTPEGAHAMPG